VTNGRLLDQIARLCDSRQLFGADPQALEADDGHHRALTHEYASRSKYLAAAHEN